MMEKRGKIDLGKKGISEVVSTVLLVLVTIVAIGLIVGFLIPWIKDKLSGAGGCIDVVDKVSINEDTIYTCYDASGTAGIVVNVESGVEKLSGFEIELIGTGGGNSETFKITNETSSDKIKMLNGNYSQQLEVPLNGGARTYQIKAGFQVESAKIKPVVGKDTCSVSDSVTISTC